MQERIGFTQFGEIGLLHVQLRLIEYCMVFWMELHDLNRHFFQVGKRLLSKEFAPGFKEEAAYFVAARFEQTHRR